MIDNQTTNEITGEEIKPTDLGVPLNSHTMSNGTVMQDSDMEYPETVLRNDSVVDGYMKKLTDAAAYDGSVQEARDLAGMSVTAPKEDDSGIPQDMGDAPINTPDINLGEDESDALLPRIWGKTPDPIKRILEPFLIPFQNNKVMRGVTIGVVEGVNGTLNLLRDVNNAIVESNGREGISEEDWLQLPDIIEKGDSTTEALVGGLTQFLSVYAAAGKIGGVSKLSGTAGKVWNDMWRAGIADAAFDPEDGNLATLINMLDEDKTVAGLPIGQMNGAFTQWLGTPVAEDAEAFTRLEQRAKNLLEGAGLGMFAWGLIGGLKGLKTVMVEGDPDKFFAMLKSVGIDVDPRTFLMENKQGAENIITPQLNELGMYSQLEKAMLNNRIKTHQPEDLLRYLFKNEVSEEELTNSGVLDLINEKKAAGEKITTDEVMEVFTEMDVTQSYDVITREYGADSNNIDSMTDEDELLEIYRAGGNGEVGVNGQVLDHAEMYDDLVYQAEDISNDWLTSINGDSFNSAMDDSAAIASNELLDLEVALKKSDPAKYGDMSAREILQKVRNIDNDDVFSSDVDEAVMRIAESNYDEAPMFRWELNEGDFNYTITGNEDTGYTTTVNNGVDFNGVNDHVRGQVDFDLVYSANEAMVQVQSHANNFGDDAMSGSGTKWHEYITEESDINSYKETIITANSPSGETFKGDQGLTHFPNDDQVFHIRTTNRNSNTLFIEEIQSDWSNAISKSGVKKGETFTNPLELELITARETRDAALGPDLVDAMANVDRIEKLIHKDNMAMPVTPLAKDKWMNVGLRKAIAMAIDAGQTRVEWTTAADQVKQWGKGDKDENFEKMYINLYDKKLGGLAKKIANKYKSTSGSHFLEINDEMIKHHKSGKGDKLVSIKGSTQYA